MRVSDDRYTRDRQRLDLALRLIRHEARTFTIRQWTGLSDDRIRKLYRSYVMNHRAVRRAAAPRQVAAPGGIFLPKSGAEFSGRATGEPVCRVRSRRAGPTCESSRAIESDRSNPGTLLCQAYEAYLESACAGAHFLRARLVSACSRLRGAMKSAWRACASCGGMRLRDLLSRSDRVCGTCESANLRGGLPTYDARALLESADAGKERIRRCRTWTAPRICVTMPALVCERARGPAQPRRAGMEFAQPRHRGRRLARGVSFARRDPRRARAALTI